VLRTLVNFREQDTDTTNNNILAAKTPYPIAVCNANIFITKLHTYNNWKRTICQFNVADFSLNLIS